MIDRLYLCPLREGTDGSAMAATMAEVLGGPRVVRLFSSPDPWLACPQTAQVEAARAVGGGEVVIDATLPAVPYGSDPIRLHTLAAPHLHAHALGLLDATDLSLTQLREAGTVIARRFTTAYVPLLAIVVTNATQLPEDTDVPLIAMAPEELGDPQALRERLAPVLSPDTIAPTSPVAYQQLLTERAGANRRRIVLPESGDERILRAAAKLREIDVVDLILLGEADVIARDADKLGLSLEGITVISPADAERRERYARELAVVREKKGMTYDKALAQLDDINYFATMMVYLGEADGMVSGAIHTTAETIRPALQIIKTKPGTSTVSGAFLMLFADRAYLFADCAVTIDPTPAQLADIAVTSAKTAEAFGIAPRVALISYSTLGSGSGPSVDKVTEATALAQAAAPEIAIDGPLQFDAAQDRAVAATKAPDSPVAGQASVYIFNHLDVGNCTYKAAQRMAGALAVGPVLQGLRKPVNDLSRGALVDDIVNTVIITAVQAQD
ncbi:phosphate acetyltransferase [Nanchangia anserum]|uniref:Phosphate acetyltransferase n=2 Tax=Nanchangia anserum TaxID=2692125 RepID=A0A8I0GD75_9ACTO|nr:phosphate acetyltransferase [Nanchangia anserum]QOX82565.1 phosphate acetyltransferase [Nanchangia anserum]